MKALLCLQHHKHGRPSRSFNSQVHGIAFAASEVSTRWGGLGETTEEHCQGVRDGMRREESREGWLPCPFVSARIDPSCVSSSVEDDRVSRATSPTEYAATWRCCLPPPMQTMQRCCPRLRHWVPPGRNPLRRRNMRKERAGVSQCEPSNRLSHWNQARRAGIIQAARVMRSSPGHQACARIGTCTCSPGLEVLTQEGDGALGSLMDVSVLVGASSGGHTPLPSAVAPVQYAGLP
jgi:hypothetical protein